MLKQAENEPMIESGYFRKELRYEHEYYARCKRFDRILKVAIYLTKNLAAGGRKPVYELFLDYDAQDFLTYSFIRESIIRSQISGFHTAATKRKTNASLC